MRMFCNAKDSHIFPTKKSGAFVIFMFQMLTNNVNFEQPARSLPT